MGLSWVAREGPVVSRKKWHRRRRVAPSSCWRRERSHATAPSSDGRAGVVVAALRYSLAKAREPGGLARWRGDCRRTTRAPPARAACATSPDRSRGVQARCASEMCKKERLAPGLPIALPQGRPVPSSYRMRPRHSTSPPTRLARDGAREPTGRAAPGGGRAARPRSGRADRRPSSPRPGAAPLRGPGGGSSGR